LDEKRERESRNSGYQHSPVNAHDSTPSYLLPRALIYGFFNSSGSFIIRRNPAVAKEELWNRWRVRISQFNRVARQLNERSRETWASKLEPNEI
jgi:hypothetical protein